MSVAVIISNHNSESQVRGLIAAAKAADNGEIMLWCLGSINWKPESLPVNHVLLLRVNTGFLPGDLVSALENYYEQFRPHVLIFADDYAGNDLAVGLSHCTGGTYVKGVTGLTRLPAGYAITRRAYGLHLECQFEYYSSPCLFSVSDDSFEEIRGSGQPDVTLGYIDCTYPRYKNHMLYQSEKKLDITSKEIILIGGRGIGSKENAENLLCLGGLMDAGVGATRPAIYNGWFDISCLIGASGKSVSPKLCMVFGASGCVPLLLGIKKSKKIIAVNSDPQARIFDSCDVGLVADCNKVICSLIKRLRNRGTLN